MVTFIAYFYFMRATLTLCMSLCITQRYYVRSTFKAGQEEWPLLWGHRWFPSQFTSDAEYEHDHQYRSTGIQRVTRLSCMIGLYLSTCWLSLIVPSLIGSSSVSECTSYLPTIQFLLQSSPEVNQIAVQTVLSDKFLFASTKVRGKTRETQTVNCYC